MQRKYDELGLECHFYHAGKPAPSGAEIAFLRKVFARKAYAPDVIKKGLRVPLTGTARS